MGAPRIIPGEVMGIATALHCADEEHEKRLRSLDSNTKAAFTGALLRARATVAHLGAGAGMMTADVSTTGLFAFKAYGAPGAPYVAQLKGWPQPLPSTPEDLPDPLALHTAPRKITLRTRRRSLPAHW